MAPMPVLCSMKRAMALPGMTRLAERSRMPQASQAARPSNPSFAYTGGSAYHQHGTIGVPGPRPTGLRRPFASAPKAYAAALDDGPAPAGSGSHRAPLDNRHILGLVLRERRHLALAAVSLVLCVASNLASPVLSGVLFEVLVQGQPFEQYSKILVVLMASYVLEPLLTRVYIRELCEAGEKVQAHLRKEAFRVLLMQRIDFFDKHHAGQLTALLTRDLDSIRSFVFGNVSRDRGLRAICEGVGSVLVLSVLSWRLGPVLAIVILATAATAWLYKRQTRAAEQAHGQAQSRMAQVAEEALANIRTVRVFAGEALERERFGACVADSFEGGIGFAHAKATAESLNRGAIHLSLLALYALGGWLVERGLMPIRTLLSAIGFTFSLVFASQGVLQTFTDARQTLSAIRRVQGVLSALPPDPSMAQALPPGAWWEVANNAYGRCNLASESVDDAALSGSSVDMQCTASEAARQGDLELININFSYPARPDVMVLKDLCLRLPRGKVTALVGRSGAGKSTVAALIERLYSPDEGQILLDGTSIAAFSRLGWVESLGAVTQESVMFSGSIYDNICYGKPHASTEEVERAAQAANAHDFIQALPDGYHTIVGERGGLLSGGQRQRVALARALLKDAPILILDEATSALDVESEQLVQEALDRLMEGRTTLVIAHRLSTVIAADQIVVLEAGAVVERGTHVDLIQQGGRYSKLVSSQSLTLSTSV